MILVILLQKYGKFFFRLDEVSEKIKEFTKKLDTENNEIHKRKIAKLEKQMAFLSHKIEYKSSKIVYVSSKF